MADQFFITRDLSRREIERHQKRFVGITASSPVHKDVNGLLEWTCNVRVGSSNQWAVIKDVLISQWALGIVTDMNVPVLCERSESGMVTIISRSQVELPDIVLTTYSYNELDFGFMTYLDENGRDSFGHMVGTGHGPAVATGGETHHQYYQYLVEWGSTEFIYGETEFGAVKTGWIES